MSDSAENALTTTSPRIFVGQVERTADGQCRVQLPDSWIYDTPQHFLARRGAMHNDVVTVFLPESIQSVIPPLSADSFNASDLTNMARVGKDFHHLTVDSSGRLPLTDADFRDLLTPEGKSAPVKLFGNVHCFSICPLNKWPDVERHLTNAVT